MCDWTSAQNASHRKGLEEGLAKGREEGLNKGMVKDKLEVAKKALAKGLSVEMIHDITELDIETIGNLTE
jgi:predicted transposase/invertase (TIGR01784 family)